jgi:hypothetical protein
LLYTQHPSRNPPKSGILVVNCVADRVAGVPQNHADVANYFGTQDPIIQSLLVKVMSKAGIGSLLDQVSVMSHLV